jgi:lipoprotein-releasing system permease protein
VRSSWIGFVAARYVSRNRKNSPSPVLAILGIATGVLALIVILSVMNGFQLGFIESILEISSYHLRIENFPPEDLDPLGERISALPGLKATVPFREFQGLLRGRRGRQQAALVRGLSPDTLDKDGGMRARMDFESGAFDLSDGHSIILGAELARRLALRTGDELTLFSVADMLSSAGDEAETAFFRVTGIFRTGYYEYDLSWAFVNIQTAAALSSADISLGIKLKDRWQDQRVLELAKKALADLPGSESRKLSSWRDYNRAFFGALRTEKLFMFLLVGLIFIVVGLNIFQAQRRAVLERREEIGLLRAVGAADRAVRLIFVWDGLFIGFAGAGTGLALGLLIAFHIPFFFTVLERIVNDIIGIANSLAGFGGEGDFAVFSPTVFYIKEIPSRVIPYEVILIFMFGFLSALLAAWFASGKISRTKPAEVLRNE